MLTINKKTIRLLHCLMPILAGISIIALLWTSQSIYTTATYYTGYFTSLPVRLSWKFNADFDLNCRNLVANRGPGSVSLSFWLKSYLSATQDPLKRDESTEAEIKCALQTIYNEKQHSLTLITQGVD